MSERKKLEQKMAETLTEGRMKKDAVPDAARRSIQARYEIRIKTENDPIKEETKIIKKMADEIDDRYEKYAANDEEKTKKNGGLTNVDKTGQNVKE